MDDGPEQKLPLMKRRWFRELVYLFAVTIHTMLVVSGCSFSVASADVEYRLLDVLAAVCLVPVLCGWAVVEVYLVVKRVRTRTPLSMRTRRLIDVPIIIALVASFGYPIWKAPGLALCPIPPVEKRSESTKQYLSWIETELQCFYRECGRLPKDLDELAEYSWPGEDPARKYIDPCSDLYGEWGTRLRYVQLDDSTVLIYSLGPDGDDDNGEKEFTEDMLPYHPSSRPWRTIPFGMWFYEASGASQKLDGDITRTISFKPKPKLPEESPER